MTSFDNEKVKWTPIHFTFFIKAEPVKFYDM